MSDDDFEAFLLSLPPSPPPGDEFKWGWNAQTGEVTVWKVSRHGNSRPFHDDYLREAWGREASSRSGDQLGSALVPDADGTATDTQTLRVLVTAYYGTQAPDVVLDWFRAEFPGRIVEQT